MKRYRFIFLFLPFFGLCCRPATKDEMTVPASMRDAAFRSIDSSRACIHNGDIIFRNGRDEVSQAARSMNRKDTSFSHCGLLFIEHDSVFVYHALGGSYNPSQKLKREWLDSFCNPAENNAFGIYRYDLKESQVNRLKTTVDSFYRAGLRFDMYFNFLTDDAMYCSEFVFKSLNKSVNGAYTRYIRMDTLPYGVTTDDIFLNEHSRLVRRKEFGW